MRNVKMKMIYYYKMMEMVRNYGFYNVLVTMIVMIMNLSLLYTVASITRIITKDNNVKFIIENAPINYKYKDRKENHKKGDKDFYEIDYYNVKPL